MSRGDRSRSITISLSLAGALALAACGDNLAPVLPDAPPGPPDAMVWNAAPHAAPPQITPSGGPVQTAPVVVPVFVKGDDLIQAEAEKFLAELAASPYWAATTREYGIGPLTVHASIVIDA